MRDFELDDSFWRDALSALGAGEPVEALADRYPDYAALIGELAIDAAAEPVLIGLRHAAADENPRLLAFLSAVFLARGGMRTLLLDLDPEVRWLEQLLGEDFKEGVVDHLQFGIPLERCARRSAVEGLEVMSGGAAFLAGSPLDDPPRFRASLLALKQGRDAVLVALPPPAESADGAGVPALCDAVVTIEDTEGRSGTALGTERGIVRLSGDPRAARELARLCHRFVGPLPALLARGPVAERKSRPAERLAAEPARPRPTDPFFVTEARSGSEELDFLSAFEGRTVPEPATAGIAEGRPRKRLEEVVQGTRQRRGARTARTAREPKRARRPLDRRALTLATVVLAAVAVLALGSRWFAPLFAGLTGDDREIAWEDPDRSPTASGEPGTVIPLTGAAPLGDEAVPDAVAPGATDGDTAVGAGAVAGLEAAAATRGEPTPYSVHVGSYRTAEAAHGVVRDLRQRGLVAFAAPVVLPDKGEWVRVYVGAYDDPEEARAALSRLTSAGVVPEGSVRDTPLAFPLGTYATPEEAGHRISELAARGIPAYAIGEGPFRVWAGAFQNEAESRLLASALDAAAADEAVELSRRER